MQKQVGNDPSQEQVKDYIWSVLKSGRVVPGYGHAVLRKPDPRFVALQQFAANDSEISQDPIFKLVNAVSRSTQTKQRGLAHSYSSLSPDVRSCPRCID